MATKNNKYVYAVALGLFAAGIVYLIVSAISSESVYFLNVAEAKAMDPAKLSQVRMFGKVSGEALNPHGDSMGVDFTLLDKENGSLSIPVNYRGVVPDTFKPGVEVIVEGGLDQSSGAFKARTLITKCPSKYEKISKDMDQTKP